MPRRMPGNPDPGRPGFGMWKDHPVDPNDPTQAQGQFNSQEKSQLKDILIQILASTAGSQLDAEIGQALMVGQDLNPNQLQHIIDESRRVKLPASHNGILQKIFSALP